jgi:hypothetical protein
MRKSLICGLLILSCFFVKAQQVNAAAEKSGMKAFFSMQAIDAYQKSSQSKVKDFFQYAELLTDDSLSEKLKSQIVQNIISLFKNKEMNTIDFTVTERKLIPLNILLQKLTGEKNIHFSVVNESGSKTLFADYWLNSYDVLVTKGNISETITVRQKIYFTPVEKHFGAASKEVWSILLGEME